MQAHAYSSLRPVRGKACWLVLTGGASGLAPVIVRTLCDTLVGLKGRFAMILVEQNRAFLGGVADRILEMRSGRLVEVYAKSQAENSAAKDLANLA